MAYGAVIATGTPCSPTSSKIWTSSHLHTIHVSSQALSMELIPSPPGIKTMLELTMMILYSIPQTLLKRDKIKIALESKLKLVEHTIRLSQETCMPTYLISIEYRWHTTLSVWSKNHISTHSDSKTIKSQLTASLLSGLVTMSWTSIVTGLQASTQHQRCDLFLIRITSSSLDTSNLNMGTQIGIEKWLVTFSLCG